MEIKYGKKLISFDSPDALKYDGKSDEEYALFVEIDGKVYYYLDEEDLEEIIKKEISNEDKRHS